MTLFQPPRILSSRGVGRMGQSRRVRARNAGRVFLGCTALLAVVFGSGGCGTTTVTPPPRAAAAPGWGIDAVLTGHIKAEERPAYLALLRESGIGWLRERGPNAAFGELQSAGFRVISFLGLQGVRPERPENQLPEDLLAVYRAAEAMVRTYPAVEAWEMVGEPDVGYARDLPDRVVAFQKAVYLGISAGSAGSDGQMGGAADGQNIRTSEHPNNGSSAPAPLVLMGALALPPGPWLERAARNGLLDYTDAYNFHFYGNAEDLTGAINAHRAFIARWDTVGLARRAGRDDQPLDRGRRGMSAIGLATAGAATLPAATPLPLWITEAGLNAVDPDDILNPARRQLQADFTVSTTRQARAATDVAMFMPFILVHEGDPLAMTLAGKPEDRSGGGAEDRRSELADGPLGADLLTLRPSDPPEPQITRLPAWEAYAKFTREHPWPLRPLARKPQDPNPVVVQWLPDPATSVAHKVSGTYRFREGAPMRGEIRVYNLGTTTVRGHLRAPALGHAHVEGIAVAADGWMESPEIEIPALSRATFPVVLTPEVTGYFREDWEPVFAGPGGKTSAVFFAIERAPEERDFRAEPLVLQSLPRGRSSFPQFAEYRVGETSGAWTTVNRLQIQKVEGGATRFWTEAVENDPLQPTMAVARLNGLPAEGFIRMHLDRPMDRNTQVRVDLVDDAGQRFCIWENFGRSYARPWEDVWLNLRDFGLYIWSRATSRPEFRPERVREIQLRFYFAQAKDPIEVGFTLMRAK
jgi:hypothetical protein